MVVVKTRCSTMVEWMYVFVNAREEVSNGKKV